MPRADSTAWLRKMRPKWNLSGKTSACSGRKRARRVHQVDGRQAVLERDLLGPDVLLDGHRQVAAALHGGVVGDDHHLAAVDAADARDDAGRGRGLVVELVRGEGGELEERAAGIQQPVDAVAHEQLAALLVLGAGLLAAALANRREQRCAQVLTQGLHSVAPVRRRKWLIRGGLESGWVQGRPWSPSGVAHPTRPASHRLRPDAGLPIQGTVSPSRSHLARAKRPR